MVRSEKPGTSRRVFLEYANPAFVMWVFITGAYGLGETVVQARSILTSSLCTQAYALRAGRPAILRRNLAARRSRWSTGSRQCRPLVSTVDVDKEERSRFS